MYDDISKKELYRKYKKLFKTTIKNVSYIYRHPTVGEYITYSYLQKYNVKAANNYLVSCCIIEPMDLDFNSLIIESLSSIILENYLLNDSTKIDEITKDILDDIEKGLYPYDYISLLMSKNLNIPVDDILNLDDIQFVRYIAIMQSLLGIKSSDIKKQSSNLEIKNVPYDQLDADKKETIQYVRKKHLVMSYVNYLIDQGKSIKEAISV